VRSTLPAQLQTRERSPAVEQATRDPRRLVRAAWPRPDCASCVRGPHRNLVDARLGDRGRKDPEEKVSHRRRDADSSCAPVAALQFRDQEAGRLDCL
jgi:hypothetical protein